MDLETYRERIRVLPIRELHTLAEQDPEAAIAWSKQERTLTEAWASEHVAKIDVKERDTVLARIFERLRPGGQRRNKERGIDRSKPKIGVGYRTGMLTVVQATDQRRQGYIVWQCRCDCGGDILLDTRRLQRGTIQDCGCRSHKVKPGQRDLTGCRFGKLICLEPTEQRGPSGGVVWRCRCDCGNECLAVSIQLIRGLKKSCGCLEHPPLKPWLGKRFGSLTVVGYAGRRGGVHLWRCRCDCGNTIVATQPNLQDGHTKSCGCLQKSTYQENLKLVGGTSVAALESRLRGGTIRSNTSGYNGVYRDHRTGKWTAQITFKGKTYFLGSYTDIQDAIKARRKGEEMYEDFLDWYYAEYCKGKGKAVGYDCHTYSNEHSTGK